MIKGKIIIVLIALFIVGCSSTHIVSMDKNIIAPKLIDKPLFIYPHSAQVNNHAGKVYLILKINKLGKVESVILDKSSGYGILDESAIASVKQFKYKPAELNGQPIDFYLKQTVDYDLLENPDLAKKYVNKVKDLKKKIEYASPEKQIELQKKLLSLYKDFISSNMDFVVFNKNIGEFVAENSYSRWNDASEDWPLHFVVFDDFQKSYPNSSVIDDARKLMFEYLKKDYETAKVVLNTNRIF
ncbi:MAG: energy transducer TonB [Calditrichaceae bacterium]